MGPSHSLLPTQKKKKKMRPSCVKTPSRPPRGWTVPRQRQIYARRIVIPRGLGDAAAEQMDGWVGMSAAWPDGPDDAGDQSCAGREEGCLLTMIPSLGDLLSWFLRRAHSVYAEPPLWRSNADRRHAAKGPVVTPEPFRRAERARRAINRQRNKLSIHSNW